MIRYMYVDSKNDKKFNNMDNVKNPFICRQILLNYKCCYWHGEGIRDNDM